MEVAALLSFPAEPSRRRGEEEEEEEDEIPGGDDEIFLDFTTAVSAPSEAPPKGGRGLETASYSLS